MGNGTKKRNFDEMCALVSIPYGKWNHSIPSSVLWCGAGFQYPMGNGTELARLYNLCRIGFNTLWEMEPYTISEVVRTVRCFNTLWEMEPTTICCYNHYSTQWIVRQGFFKKVFLLKNKLILF